MERPGQRRPRPRSHHANVYASQSCPYVAGRERVAKFITAFASHFWTGVTLTWIQTNGQSSVLISRDGAVVTVATIDASAEGINQILWMMRPSKLTAISKSYQAKINRDFQTP